MSDNDSFYSAESLAVNAMDTMNDSQKETLVKFREKIKDVRHPLHDDHALYKWLKARSFNIKKAEDMYRKSMSWRKEIGADTIVETYTVPPVMEKYYPGGLCGADKEGRPLWVDPLGGADLKGIMCSVKKSDILKTMVYRLENLYVEFRRCTKEASRQIDQCVHIIDMEGFGSRFMWKPALDLYVEVLHLLEDNYPETLKKTYFVNAPRIFQVGYNVIKKFIDKETAKKFKFLDSNWKKELSTVLDLTNVPQHYGGQRADKDGDPKCQSLVCYGGIVPKENYRKKEEFFPSTPKPETLGRGSTLTLGYYIPDTHHVLRFIFAIDGSEVEFGAFLDPNGKKETLEELSKNQKLKDIDTSKLEVIQPMNKFECHRVPEDGMLFFEKPGVCYLQFRNPSRLLRRVVSHVIEIDAIDSEDRIITATNDIQSVTITGEDTAL